MSLFTDISKKKTLLFFYGLLLLVIEVSATTESSQEGASQAKILIDEIPRIINELGRLTNSSIQQLDTALFWSTDVLKKNESYINPSVMKMNQELTKVLRLIKNNFERIALQVLLAPSNIDTLNRYLRLYSERRSDFAKIPSFIFLHPLNELKELYEKILLLSEESSSELQRVSVFTKTFGEIAKTKLRYMENELNGSISKELDEITNQKNEVEKEIIALNEEVEKLSRSATESENKFYQMLNETQQTTQEKKQKGEKLSCYEDRIHKWNNAKDETLMIEECKILEKAKHTEINTINALRTFKRQWKDSLKFLTTNENILATKRETKHILSITFQKLEFKKNKLVKDISFLVNTKDSIDKLGKEMEKLAVGWKNLANNCQNIESVVAAVRATLSSDDTTVETAIPVNGINPSEDNDYSYEDPFSTQSVEQSVTTTTPAPQNELILCIQNSTLNIDQRKIGPIREDIVILMERYSDWGKLLAPAPVAIGILSQLVLMANRVQDFSIVNQDPMSRNNITFKHIKYPNSFRTTLLQISQSGYKSFLTAHRNMDAIRVHNEGLPNDIRDAVRYLMSTNERIINLRLFPTLERINLVIKKSEDLSKEVVDEFKQVMNLIEETELAVTATHSVNQDQLEDVNFNIKFNNHSKGFSENETLILIEKDAKMKEMLNRLEYRKDKISITTSYHGGNFTINLVKDWVQEMGETRYKKDGEFLKDTNQTWKYSYHKQFVDSNPCAQENSEQLLDLLIVFGQFRQSYEHWQNSARKIMSRFNGSSTLNSLKDIFENLKPCSNAIKSIIEKVNDLVKKLNSSNTFPSSGRETSLPCESEMYDIISLINDLRTAANKATEKSDKQVEVLTKSVWEIYEVSKSHQLDQLKSMSKTVEDIVKLNNDLMEIRRKKTREILDRIVNLNVTKVSTENVIQILVKCLSELGELKNHWAELIEFFGKIKTFIENASRHSTGLVTIVETMSRNPSVNLGTESLLEDLRINFEKSNQAVLLVHGIADVYVNVSNLYIKDRLARLNAINSLRIESTTDEDLKKEMDKLAKDTKESSEGIEKYIKARENELKVELKVRQKEVLREFRWTRICFGKHNLTDNLAENFTKADYWFQIKFRNNNKVIEVSSKNQVQMWESNNGDHQLWYLDQQQVIRSVISDFCLTSNSSTKLVTVEPCQESAINQKWTLKDNKIFNIVNNRSLNIRNRKSINGAPIEEVETLDTDQIWEVI